MIRTLAIVAGASFVIAAVCLGGAAALVGPEIARSEFWQDFDWEGGEFRHDANYDPNAPVTTTQVRDITGFTSVDVGGGLTATVTVGPEFKVEVIGVAPDLVITELNGAELDIHPQHRSWWRGVPRTRVVVSMPAISGATASAGASLYVSGVTDGDLMLNASSGASLDVRGTCASVDAEASSGASLDAENLICATGSVEASSGASIDVNVTGTLNVEASSGGSIDARGTPQIGRVNLSSGGSLDHD